MSPEKRREAAAKGGRTAQDRGTANRFKPGDKATVDAGRHGGQVSRGGRGRLNSAPNTSAA